MSAQSDALAAALTRRTEQTAIALVLEVEANIREAMPVDTGWARANVIASIGDPVTAPAGARGKPHVANRSADDAQAAGDASVLGYKLEMGSLYVGIPVDYVRFLNNGSSTKAPAAFIESSVERAIQTITELGSDLGLEAIIE